MKTPPWLIVLALIDQVPEEHRAPNWADRLQTCYDCEHLVEVALVKQQVCNKCHCVMNKKVTLKSSTCPLDKWH
jgi:hypothetical protein